MVRKRILGLLIVLISSGFFSAAGFAKDETYLGGVGQKLGRGFSNAAFSIYELSEPIEKDFERDEVWRRLPVHVVGGFSRMVQRLSVGLYEVTTCFVPQGAILKPVRTGPSTEEWTKEGRDASLDRQW